MIDVYIAEDEYGAREQVKLLVSRFDGFQVVGEAEDGDRAVEDVKRLHPDLLLTDIRMPGKSGLELQEAVSGLKPKIELVVISGYSDFSYAQTAMKNGCQDYLLKPISPKQFRQMMERVKERITERQTKERDGIFEAIVQNQHVEESRLKKYFPFGEYHLALVRKLGLPQSAGRRGVGQMLSEIGEWSCIYGRDMQESLYLWPVHAFGVPAFEKRQREKWENSQEGQEGYLTILSYGSGICVEEIPVRVRELYKALDHRLVLGRTQVLRMERLSEQAVAGGKETLGRARQEQEASRFGSGRKTADLGPLEHFVQQQEWEQAERELWKLMEWYKKNDWPLERIETDVTYLLTDLARKTGREADFKGYMEEIYCYARNMRELTEALLDYIRNTFRESGTAADKVDTEDFFERVTGYLKENAAGAVTLQEISGTFHVSLSYMSRLFKKYTGVSFNEYLTGYRIERACELFRENPDLFVKDVAGMVGIPDQFYFSRLFRSRVGKTPSQYCREVQGERGGG